MTKRNKFYQIGFFTLAIAFIGLCLFVGITAIQKQMKLNLAVKMNPSIVCEIYASMNGEDGTYNKIFSNVEGSTSIGTNWSISGNTLSYNTSSTDMGKEIYLKVTNKTTGTRVMVEYNNEVKDVIEVNGTSATAFSVSIPGNGKVQMLFSQVFKVTTTLTHASVTATTNLYEIGGTYYAKTGTTPTMTLTSDTHYTNPPSSVTVTGATKDYNTTTGVLTLSNITGDVTVTASASAATYTVSSILSGISSNTIANKATYNTNYTFTLTVASTSWIIGTVTYTVGGGSAQTLSGTTTDNLTYTYTIPGDKITGAIVINATATSPYSIYATINGEDVLIGEYSQKSTEQPITINYPSTFTGTGDLMSAVAGVGEVTATQITIAANTTGPITIVPKGYTMGTYVDSGASAVGTQVSDNTVYYPAFKGYKYIKFNGIDTWAPTYSSYSGDPVPLRFIIIGAGSNVSNATMLGAVQNTAVTSYAFSGTVNGKVGNNSKNDNLGASQVLLLSEQVVDRMYYGSDYGLWTHSDSTIRIFLNGDFYTNSGLSSYESCIDTPTLKTAWRLQSSTSDGETYNDQECVEDTGSKIFVLASRNGYFESGTSAVNGIHVTNPDSNYQTVKFGYQNYCVEDYLGTSDATFTFRIPTATSFSGGNCKSGDAKLQSIAGMYTSYWWLRSGYNGNRIYAYYVTNLGYIYIDVVSNDHGVRPSFILNLA